MPTIPTFSPGTYTVEGTVWGTPYDGLYTTVGDWRVFPQEGGSPYNNYGEEGGWNLALIGGQPAGQTQYEFTLTIPPNPQDTGDNGAPYEYQTEIYAGSYYLRFTLYVVNSDLSGGGGGSGSGGNSSGGGSGTGNGGITAVSTLAPASVYVAGPTCDTDWQNGPTCGTTWSAGATN